MITIDINLMFWTDGRVESTRERNVRYAISELKNFSDFLNTKITCKVNIFDYSPVKIIEEAIHIPYPISVFKKSEKINGIIKNCNSDMISIIDSDCFICREDYSEVLETILSSGKNSCITFDSLNINEEDTARVIYENIDAASLHTESRFPGRAGGLGGFYIVSTDGLKRAGGFNTKFTTWGGEDGEVYDKIYRDSTIEKIPIKKERVRVFHLSHFCDRLNVNYFNREEYISNNF